MAADVVFLIRGKKGGCKVGKVVYSIVVPLYNEEEVIAETYKRLKAVAETFDAPYEIIMINDGSRDRTVPMAHALCEADKTMKLIDFSRNFGHQIAVTAGMDYASGDAIIVIDADLQDPPEVIPEMISKWKQGYDVVYGVRKKRQGETFFKKLTAAAFYRFLKKMTNVDIPVDTGDFRLIDRKVCEALKRVNEKNRFIRGIISWLGFKQIGVEFVRDKRFAGETKYPLKKMLRLAANGITSFSDKPLKLASGAGAAIMMLSILYALVMMTLKIAAFPDIPTWHFLFSAVFFLNGVTLLILGIYGEYIGRIYDEAKGRPLYLIGGLTNFDDEQISYTRNIK